MLGTCLLIWMNCTQRMETYLDASSVREQPRHQVIPEDMLKFTLKDCPLSAPYTAAAHLGQECN